jgi:hypothetical protein
LVNRERSLAARPESDAGLLLFAEAEFVAVDAELAQHLAQAACP